MSSVYRESGRDPEKELRVREPITVMRVLQRFVQSVFGLVFATMLIEGVRELVALRPQGLAALLFGVLGVLVLWNVLSELATRTFLYRDGNKVRFERRRFDRLRELHEGLLEHVWLALRDAEIHGRTFTKVDRGKVLMMGLGGRELKVGGPYQNEVEAIRGYKEVAAFLEIEEQEHLRVGVDVVQPPEPIVESRIANFDEHEHGHEQDEGEETDVSSIAESGARGYREGPR